MQSERTPSQAQIDANRRNAQKSTGPRTAAGKNTASRNAIRHGLRANKHIILDEDPQDFLDLLDDCYDTHAPVGLAEDRIVLRIAYDSWRRDRTYGIEEGLYRNCLDELAENDFAENRKRIQARKDHEAEPFRMPPPADPPSEHDRAARAFMVEAFGNPSIFGLLARYQAALDRSIDRSIKILAKFQAARKRNNPEPAPEILPDEILPNEAKTGPEEPAGPPVTPSTTNSCQTNPNYGSIPESALPDIPPTVPKVEVLGIYEASQAPKPHPERQS